MKINILLQFRFFDPRAHKIMKTMKIREIKQNKLALKTYDLLISNNS